MDFKNFLKNYNNNQNNADQQANSHQGQNNQTNSQTSNWQSNNQANHGQFGASEEELTQKIKQYQNKSQDDIMSELASAVNAARANGSLSNSDLEGFYAQVSPMLNDEQKARMRDVLDKL